MNRKKLFAAIISLALVIAMALPGTLAVSIEQTSAEGTVSAGADTAEPSNPDPTPDEPELPAEPDEPDGEPDKICTCDPQPAEGEPHQEGCPLYVAPEEPAEEEPICTCDPHPAEGEPHQEGCPLYAAPEEPAEEEPERPLYERLLAAATAEEFMQIATSASDEELSALTDEEFDAVDAYYIFLTTGAYPDYSPVVDEVMEIVDYTYVAPLGEPVTGGYR